MAVDLYADQIAAVEKLRTGSILRGGVGSGKTRTALTYYYTKVCGGKLRINGYGQTTLMKNKKLLYVITTAKTRDDGSWDLEALKFPEVHPIVDSWNNIKKYADVKGAFFIFDEQRVVGYSTWAKNFIHIARNNDWIMLTATPGDTWIEYAPVLIANGYYRNITDFRNRHVVYSRYTKYPKIEKYINIDRLEAIRNQIVVPMSDNRRTIVHHKHVVVDYDHDLFDIVYEQRWNPIEQRPIRNASELCYLLRKIVNSDTSRIDAIEDLLVNGCNTSVIFYNFDYELEILKDRLESLEWPYSEWNGHKHEAIKTGDRWAYLVQYNAGAEGWNCTTTDTIIYYSQNYSYKLMEQSSGRINRMNTPYTDLYYYHLRSNSKIDNAIKRALENKRRFNEKQFFDSI